MDEFKVGDFVFARVRGYPPWPAKIIEIADQRPANMKFNVLFYGTGETGVCTLKEVFHYKANKERMGKNVKRKNFSEGIRELEAEMKRREKEDSAEKPSSVDSSDEQKPEEKISKIKTNDEEPNSAKRIKKGTSIDGKEKEGETNKIKPVEALKDEIKEEEEKKKIKATEEDKKSLSRRSSRSAGDNAKEMGEDAPPAKKRKVNVSEDSQKKKSSTGETESSKKDAKEQMSRSGRVIKPKKFLYNEEKVSGKSDSQSPENAQSPKKNQKSPEKAAAPETPTTTSKSKLSPPLKLSPIGRHLWMKHNGKELVQIQVDHERPKHVKDETVWEQEYSHYLKKFLTEVKDGKLLPDNVKFQLQPPAEQLESCTEEEKCAYKKLAAYEHIKGSERWMRVESRLVEINYCIRQCLQKKKIDLEKAVNFLNELMTLPLDPLMLKKRPGIVETIQKVRRYNGNLGEWNLSEAEEKAFMEKASILRSKADMLYNRFCSLFAVKELDKFWSTFVNSVSEFNQATKDLPEEKLSVLTCDPSSEFYNDVLAIYDEEEKLKQEVFRKLEGR